MYQNTVTIFNRYESQDKIFWYPHVLQGVDLIIDKGANIAKTGLESADTAKLHIKYHLVGGNKMVGRFSWLPPKEWDGQTNDMLSKTITFTEGEDFFWEGEYSENMIDDDEYQGLKYSGFYDYMNKRYDNVFLITTVGGPYTLIPHFEIGGK